MSIRNKVAAVCSLVLGSVPVFAQGEGAGLTVDTSTAEDAVSAVGTALSGLITGKITENVLLILGAGLVIAAIFLGIRWMMRGGKAAAR